VLCAVCAGGRDVDERDVDRLVALVDDADMAGMNRAEVRVALRLDDEAVTAVVERARVEGRVFLHRGRLWSGKPF
jgi:hypothetical protein